MGRYEEEHRRIMFPSLMHETELPFLPSTIPVFLPSTIPVLPFSSKKREY